MSANRLTDKPKTLAIIQARVRSERLPGKSIMPLCGKPMLLHIIERASFIEGIDRVIVATGNRIENKEIERISENRAEIFFGDDFDVLSRFYLSAEPYCPDYIIRITGDNPFTDVALANRALLLAAENNADLSSVIDIPLGTAVEIISFSALKESFLKAERDHQREHVTPYIKEHPHIFNIIRFSPPDELKWPELRLTVDTEEDFALAAAVYDSLYKGSYFSLEKTICLIKSRPDLFRLNENVTQRPMTHFQNRSCI